MAAITAAVVGGVATAAAAGMSAMNASQTPSQGRPPDFKQAPMNPQDKAMKDYFDRMTVANANKTYPSFSGFLESGGDPSKAQFPMTMPDLTPNEAAALGFVGGKGEPVPGVSQASVSGVGPQTTQLSQQQMMYMAKERARQAALSGQKPGPWAGGVMTKQQNLNRIGQRISDLTAKQTSMGDTAPPRLGTRITNLQTRQSNIQDRLNKALSPGGGGVQ